MFWIVLLLILLGGGFYFYQRMVTLEQEIRAEQAHEKEQREGKGSQELSVAASLEKESAQLVAQTGATGDSAAEVIENPILRIICVQPGIVQTDLYADLPHLNKKQAQQMVRELVAAGKVRRERLGSSYKLYLV